MTVVPFVLLAASLVPLLEQIVSTADRGTQMLLLPQVVADLGTLDTFRARIASAADKDTYRVFPLLRVAAGSDTFRARIAAVGRDMHRMFPLGAASDSDTFRG